MGLKWIYRCCVVLCVNNAMSEMVTYLPISSPFVRFAGRFVDPSFGVAAGWNFFVFVRPHPANICHPQLMMAGSGHGAIRDRGVHPDLAVLGHV